MVIETGTFHENKSFFDSDRKVKLLLALSQSAEKLTSGQGWPGGVHTLLRDLGGLTGVSRVWIFQIMKLTSSHITQDYTFEWAAKPEYEQIGMSQFSMFTNRLDKIEYQNLIESRKKGEWQKVLVNNLKAGSMKEDLKEQKILSMLTIPIFIQNRWWGTLGFDDCEREYNWSAAEIAILRIGGFLISNAVLSNRLDATRKQFSLLKNITDSSLWSLDFKTQHVRFTNNLSGVSLGLSTNNEVPLRVILRIFHPQDRKRLIRYMRSYDLNTGRSIRIESRILEQDSRYKWLEIIANISFDTNNRPVQCAGIAIDISSRKMVEAKLRKEASTDPLTKIFNRRMFQLKFRELVDESERTEEPISLFMLDIDFFKQVNDKWGHDCGDKILVHMVAVVSKMLRQYDVFARIGGEEFVVLLPGIATKQAVKIGNRIRRAIAELPYIFKGIPIQISVSIGCVTCHGEKSTNIDELFLAADKALFSAKEGGRNKLIVFQK